MLATLAGRQLSSPKSLGAADTDVLCWRQGLRAALLLRFPPLLSPQSITPLMKFLESELQYLNVHLVQENFNR